MKKAAMLFHPPNLTIVDETVVKVMPFLKNLYSRISEIKKKNFFRRCPPFKFFNVDNFESVTGKKIGLLGVMLPWFPEQLVSGDRQVVQKEILKAISLAKKNKAEIITLGAFTSIVTNQGKDLVGKTPIAITSGNTYTAALCIRSIFEICQKLEVDLNKVSLCIVGATGDIGSMCAKVLSKYVKKLILCSRSISNTSEIVVEIERNMNKRPIIMNQQDEAVREGDIIISATSSWGLLFNHLDLKPGTILCDISMPPNVARNIRKERKDILAYSGGRAQFLNFMHIKNPIWKAMFPTNNIYGCMVESLILALEDRFENFSLGRATSDEKKIDEIYDLGIKHGFSLAKFNNFNYIYSIEDFNYIKSILH